MGGGYPSSQRMLIVRAFGLANLEITVDIHNHLWAVPTEWERTDSFARGTGKLRSLGSSDIPCLKKDTGFFGIKRIA